MVKTRLQLDKSTAEKSKGILGRQYRNSWDCTRQIVRHEGLRGLYRGLSASYLGVSESSLQWVLFEQGKKWLGNRQERLVASGREPGIWDAAVQWGGKLTAAGGAKLLAAVITYPHEVRPHSLSLSQREEHLIESAQVVRTRLRLAPTENGRMKYTGLVQCFRLIWKEEGLASMYGGLTPHLLRVVPSAAIMFGT